jgi:hypothetical protein
MESKSRINSIGIDLGKTTFHLVALGTRSQAVIRKKAVSANRQSVLQNRAEHTRNSVPDDRLPNYVRR